MKRASHNESRALRNRVTRHRAPLGAGARHGVFAVLAVASLAAGASAHETATRRLAEWAPSWFRISRAEVAGVSTIPASELRRRIGPLGAGRGGALHLAELEARLSAHPRVAQARVSNALPGVLLIRVVERQPVARVRDPAGEWWVDATGMPFEPGGTERAAIRADELPLLVTASAVALGTRNAALASAIGSILQLRAAGLVVSEWLLDNDPSQDSPRPRVRLRGAMPPLLLGDGDRGAQIHALARALAVGQLRNAAAIDLRFRDQVIFWPALPDLGAAGKRAPPEGLGLR